MAGHGGRRPGAGRKPGSVNRRSDELAARLDALECDPAARLVEVGLRAELMGDDKLAAMCWSSLLPYRWPKLRHVELAGEIGIEMSLARRLLEARRRLEPKPRVIDVEPQPEDEDAGDETARSQAPGMMRDDDPRGLAPTAAGGPDLLEKTLIQEAVPPTVAPRLHQKTSGQEPVPTGRATPPAPPATSPAAAQPSEPQEPPKKPGRWVSRRAAEAAPCPPPMSDYDPFAWTEPHHAELHPAGRPRRRT